MSSYRPQYDSTERRRPFGRDSRDSLRDEARRERRKNTDADGRGSQAEESALHRSESSVSLGDAWLPLRRRDPRSERSPRIGTRRHPAQLRSSPSYEPSSASTASLSATRRPRDPRAQILCRDLPHCRYGHRCAYLHPDRSEDGSESESTRAVLRRHLIGDDEKMSFSGTKRAWGTTQRQLSPSNVSLASESLNPLSGTSQTLYSKTDVTNPAVSATSPDLYHREDREPWLERCDSGADAEDGQIPKVTSTDAVADAWGASSPAYVTPTGIASGAAAWGSPSPPPSTTKMGWSAFEDTTAPAAGVASRLPNLKLANRPTLPSAMASTSSKSGVTLAVKTSQMSSTQPTAVSPVDKAPSLNPIPALAGQSNSSASLRGSASIENREMELSSLQAMLPDISANDKQETPSTSSEEDMEIDEIADDDNTSVDESVTPVSPDIMALIARATTKPVTYLSTAELLDRFDREFPHWLSV